VPLCAFMVAQRGGWGELAQAWRQPGVRLTLLGSSVLISINWLGFVYAVETRQVLQASLGYYINPLVNVLLAMIFLGERLRLWQGLAVLLALSGTLVLALGYGHAPWLGLMLACTFGTYGLLRKRVAIDAVGGLFVETALLAPLALGWLLWLASRGELALVNHGWGLTALLLSAGLATSLPLVWFTRAARRISLTALGMVMYLTPTLQFSLAVFVYGETFTSTHLLSFSLIWCGLAVFMAESFHHSRGLPPVR
jgi:chloramphenicol-sensitive protein RarD